MSEHDAKRIIRQWNREIDHAARRNPRRRDEGPWRTVVWFALWVLWLALLIALLGLMRRLHW